MITFVVKSIKYSIAASYPLIRIHVLVLYIQNSDLGVHDTDWPAVARYELLASFVAQAGPTAVMIGF